MVPTKTLLPEHQPSSAGLNPIKASQPSSYMFSKFFIHYQTVQVFVNIFQNLHLYIFQITLQLHVHKTEQETDLN